MLNCTHTSAGTYASDSWSFTGAGNYHDIASTTITDIISQAPSVTTVSCPTDVTYTYNGSAQMPCSTSVTGAGGLNLTPTPGYSSNVNAGTATASYTFAGDANHTGSNDSKTFTIAKANPMIGVSGYNVPYDGNPHTATGTATGVMGENL